MSTSPGLTAVALNLGSVLVDVQRARLAPLLRRPEPDVDAAFFGDGRHDALNRGELDAVTYLQRAANRLDLPVSAVEAAWRAFVVTRPGAAALVSRITVPVTVWSNTDAVHADALRPTLPPELFERAALSFAVGARKPEAAFYAAGLALLQVPPAQVLFVDDLDVNVAAARALGVRAARADTLAGVEQALANAAVLSPLR